jgi:tripartite-type tricarboxylate transporter receptor subunit TctC
VIEQYAKVAGIAIPSTPAEYAAFIDSEQAKWGPVVKAIGFKQQQ